MNTGNKAIDDATAEIAVWLRQANPAWTQETAITEAERIRDTLMDAMAPEPPLDDFTVGTDQDRAPETFMDQDDDTWVRVPTGRYRCRTLDLGVYSLDEVTARYGPIHHKTWEA